MESFQCPCCDGVTLEERVTWGYLPGMLSGGRRARPRSPGLPVGLQSRARVADHERAEGFSPVHH